MEPKLLCILKNRKKELTPTQLKKDIISGIIVAIIALPLSVALGIASGVSPEKGLITAVIAGFIISLLGGSRVQIGGPTGAFVVIIYGIVSTYGLDGLLISTIMAGVLMILMGIFKLGAVIRYIPYPTTTGFTAGIAVVLFSTQIKDFLGLNISLVPSEFIAKWKSYIDNFNTINITTTAIGALSLIIIILWPKINKAIPGSLVALIIATVIVNIFHLPVETIGSRFGEINSSIKLISFSNINISFDTISNLINPAITIALLASIESLLSAVVADGMIGKKHDSNMELIAQGFANIGSALFGGIPATGAIARTAANIKNGGRTPIAGMVHSITLLLIMLILMPLAKLIPMTTLGAILIVVSYNMCGWRYFKSIFASTKSDVIVLLSTFLMTVIFDLVVAIEVGMVLAMFLFVKRMSEDKLIQDISSKKESYNKTMEDSSIEKYINDGISLFEINGPLFYGAVNNFLNLSYEMSINTKILILEMKNVNCMDATALNGLKQLDERCRSQKILILYTQLNSQPEKLLNKSGFIKTIGNDRFYDSIEDAFSSAKEILKIDYKKNGWDQ